MDDRQLLIRAQEAAANSYAPYCQVPKGAALLGKSGTVYVAAYVDNAAYSASICAEAAALAAAVGNGERYFSKIALAPHRLPCGSCLQSLREFGLNLQIISENENGAVSCSELENLLPMSFGPDYLKIE
jgi:cytidine deaminase